MIADLVHIDCVCVCVRSGNLPDPGKAQDFVKKLAQVLDDDERIRDQLETLVSPSCSCKQAEVCVVSFGPSKVSSKLKASRLFKMTIYLLLVMLAARHH